MLKTEQKTRYPCPGTDLIERCLMGDRAAREELARTCLPRVRKTVLLMSGDGPDTDDLVQTALMRAFTGLPGFRGQALFTTWLDRVTVNTVKQYYRRRPLESLFPTSDLPEKQAPNGVLDPDRLLEEQRMFESLISHLLSIRPKKRIAVVLAAAYGYSMQEVADIMDCSLETAKKRLQHGRRELFSRMNKDRYLSQALKEIAICVP